MSRQGRRVTNRFWMESALGAIAHAAQIARSRAGDLRAPLQQHGCRHMNPISSATNRPPARQHGAMEYGTPPADLDEVAPLSARADTARPRQARSRGHHPLRPDQHPLRRRRDQHADLVRPQRGSATVYVPAEGPVVLFEFGGKDLLSSGLPTIDEVRPAIVFLYFGDRVPTGGQRQGVGSGDGLADPREQRRQPTDRHRPYRAAGRHRGATSRLRSLRRLRGNGERTRDQVHGRDCAHAPLHRGMRAGDRPDARRDAARHHGECPVGGAAPWQRCRGRRMDRDPPAFPRGPRTNPWFREASMRVIERGDMVAFDTDLVGPYGYCCDISRTWVCDAPPKRRAASHLRRRPTPRSRTTRRC